MLQPLDVCINKPFKDYFREEWGKWLSSDDPEDCTYTAQRENRRKPSYQKLVDMVSKCHQRVAEKVHMIKRAFTSTGLIGRSILGLLDPTFSLLLIG